MLFSFCQFLDKEAVGPFQSSILEGACQLLPSATEEALMLVLETIMSAAKVGARVLLELQAFCMFEALCWLNKGGDFSDRNIMGYEDQSLPITMQKLRLCMF